MWYLPDTQHILLTLDFLRITQHLAGPRHVCLGSRYVAVLSTTHPQHTLWERHKHHKSSNATIPDPQHTSRGLSIYRGSVCLMSPTHMPNKHIMWYLLDTQHILLTRYFLRIVQHLAGPRHVCLGSGYVAVLSTTHPQITLWERHKHHKSSNATIPDPQHTSRGLSIYRGSLCFMSPTYMPN